jgi:hypothetical protein
MHLLQAFYLKRIPLSRRGDDTILNQSLRSTVLLLRSPRRSRVGMNRLAEEQNGSKSADSRATTFFLQLPRSFVMMIYPSCCDCIPGLSSGHLFC